MSNDTNSLQLASLGTATGTLVDSPAKHIMACKMDTNYLITLLKDRTNPSTDALTMLHDNKMRYCMHKHELALFTGKKLCPQSSFVNNNAKAYPLVITTVADMHELTRRFLMNLYSKATPYEFYELCHVISGRGGQQWISSQPLREKVFGNDGLAQSPIFNANAAADMQAQKTAVLMQVQATPDFRLQGVALGQAWASHMSGDTVASVMVGGVQTVQNGAFPMQTGDLVQWYFDFEESMFETQATTEQGQRRTATADRPTLLGEAQNSRKRQYMDEKTFGVAKGYGQDFQQIKNTKGVVRIKSYKLRPSTYTMNRQQITLPSTESYGDKIRVFAKCVSGGRPYDQVDIMLMTQSS